MTLISAIRLHPCFGSSRSSNNDCSIDALLHTYQRITSWPRGSRHTFSHLGPELIRVGWRVHCTELTGGFCGFKPHTASSIAFRTLEAPTTHDCREAVSPNPWESVGWDSLLPSTDGGSYPAAINKYFAPETHHQSAGCKRSNGRTLVTVRERPYRVE